MENESRTKSCLALPSFLPSSALISNSDKAISCTSTGSSMSTSANNWKVSEKKRLMQVSFKCRQQRPLNTLGVYSPFSGVNHDWNCFWLATHARSGLSPPWPLKIYWIFGTFFKGTVTEFINLTLLKGLSNSWNTKYLPFFIIIKIQMAFILLRQGLCDWVHINICCYSSYNECVHVPLYIWCSQNGGSNSSHLDSYWNGGRTQRSRNIRNRKWSKVTAW